MIGWEQFGPVLVVFGLLAATLWWLKQKGLANIALPGGRTLRGNKRSLESLERLPLTAQHSLHLVRANGKTLLIGVAPSGCNVLADYGDQAPALKDLAG